jgi:ATP-binding cassette subfamily F protein uup
MYLQKKYTCEFTFSRKHIETSFGERTCLKTFLSINKDQKLLSTPKNGSGKTTIMSIINGLEEAEILLCLEKGLKWRFVPNNNLQDELTIEEKYFCL